MRLLPAILKGFCERGLMGPAVGRLAAVLAICLCVAVLAGGCVTKATAEAEARAAYMAGRQSAFKEMLQQENHGTNVTVIGQVQHPVVQWTKGMTLRQAIVKANYNAPSDPRNILIERGGKQIQFDPKRLLRGEDFPLQPGDIIQLEE